jgi:hypothetical protein
VPAATAEHNSKLVIAKHENNWAVVPSVNCRCSALGSSTGSPNANRNARVTPFMWGLRSRNGFAPAASTWLVRCATLMC